MLDLQLQWGSATFSQTMLHDVVGPLVRPLCLSGPYSMQGWSFLWALLSTTIVIGYWNGAAAWIGFTRERRGLTAMREVGRMTIALLVFFAPALVRIGLRVLSVLGS